MTPYVAREWTRRSILTLDVTVLTLYCTVRSELGTGVAPSTASPARAVISVGGIASLPEDIVQSSELGVELDVWSLGIAETPVLAAIAQPGDVAWMADAGLSVPFQTRSLRLRLKARRLLLGLSP